MRKIFQVFAVVLIFLFACSSPTKSNEIEIQQAVKIAINTAKSDFTEANRKYQVKRVHFYPDLASPTLYIIDLKPSGFVLVANENNTFPVLGFSENGHFGWDEAPPALQQIIKDYHKQIIQIRENNYQASEEIKAK